VSGRKTAADQRQARRRAMGTPTKFTVRGTIKQEGQPDAIVSAECEYDFGANLAECSTMWGEAATYELAVAKAKINLQNLIRNALEKGVKPEEAISLAKNWKPGVSMRGALAAPAQDPLEALLAKVASGEMNAADLKRTIAERLAALKG